MRNTDWWLLILWHVVPSPGEEEQAGQAGRATSLPWQPRGWVDGVCLCVGADDVMSFCGRLYAQAQVKQSTGCQEATYLHYLILGFSDVCSRCCALINAALIRQQHIRPAVPDIKQFSHRFLQPFTHLCPRYKRFLFFLFFNHRNEMYLCNQDFLDLRRYWGDMLILALDREVWLIPAAPWEGLVICIHTAGNKSRSRDFATAHDVIISAVDEAQGGSSATSLCQFESSSPVCVESLWKQPNLLKESAEQKFVLINFG